MGRWKDNGSGQAYWDANDTGPDQIAGMPPGGPAATSAAPVVPHNSEGAGGITGKNDQPGGLYVAAPPTTSGLTTPERAGDTFEPGQGGQWSMNGSQAGTLQSILQALQAKYGSPSGGIIGLAEKGIQNKINTGLTPPNANQTAGVVQPPKTTGWLGGLGRSLGGSLFG